MEEIKQDVEKIKNEIQKFYRKYDMPIEVVYNHQCKEVYCCVKFKV